MFLLYFPKGYKVKGDLFESIANNIQTFDVLLRRYDTYLDKAFIPGYWNHAAVCSEGAGAFSKILHATSDGVNEASLFDFMKTDHVCLLRPMFYFDGNKLKKIMQKMLTLPYDFDFDFDDPSKFSCSEVVEHLFSGYQHGIKREKFLGSLIVPPDNILRSKNFKNIIGQ